jgi:hypothetical protein
MADPITLLALTAFITKNAHSWYTSLRTTVLGKGQEVAIDKGKEFATSRSERLTNRLFHLDEREQLHHLQLALKNATERGLVTFDGLAQRDQYKDILWTLSQPGPLGDTLRLEMLQLLTLSETPDFAKLSDTYNQRKRFYDATHQDVDVALYLNSFFRALLGELYNDPYFKAQLSEALQLRAAATMQQSLFDIVSILKHIGEMLEDNYSPEDFEEDVAVYTAYVERSLRNLKIIGIVPKDQTTDPELHGIFVPLRVTLSGRSSPELSNIFTPSPINVDRDIARLEPQPDGGIIAALEQYPCLVVLGGPGSGKSTMTKHLAWSHMATDDVSASRELLSGHPVPLRIELRRLNEERKKTNYDFLTFATEVLLKREGIEINPKMFKALLTRRRLLLLFDGLDEAGTPKERLDLVNEIEHFALSYPGNRVLVTSRPVGYQLAPVSHPLFFQAEVQSFNDAQIQQFLENWYTAVLRLSPIPKREQEELDLLLTTLKGNIRLHRLAENPLLLTVITMLHRYERLPDRRVLVYDRCADLLLETWAKLRGTDARWQDINLVKEDQYACIAALGFVLHTRSQEESDDDKAKDTTVDVSSRFLRDQVEAFLKKKELANSLVEQRRVATRFIELAQEEAGLIVERGTDDNGELLYSFVHRTFQEYFAAADVYERYQQEEDAGIISIFLSEHLHDPHWREVILLLLAKLKSMPVTKQLQQLLQGDIISLRSCYTDIVQQDLFFVCDCFIEGIRVENSLIQEVVRRLENIVREEWRFLSQKKQALEYLGNLMLIRQSYKPARNALLACVKKDNVASAEVQLEAIQVFYLSSANFPEDRQLASQLLTSFLQRPELSIEQVRQTAESLYQRSSEGSEAKQLATRMLSELLQRPELSIEQVWQTAESLYYSSPVGSKAEQLALRMLSELLQRPELSIEQVRQTAESLYDSSLEGSKAQQQATRMLSELLQRPELSIEQVWQTAESLYDSSPGGSKARQLALRMLSELLQRPELPIEQVRQTAESLYDSSPVGSKAEQLATRMLSELLQRPELPIEQVRQTAESLYDSSSEGSKAQQLATRMLSELLQRPELSIEQVWQTAESLYDSSPGGSKAQQLATRMLSELLQRPELSIEQVWQTVESLYQRSSEGSKAQQLATRMLSELLQRPELSIEQVRQTAESLYQRSSEGSKAQQLATRMLSELLQRPELPIEQVRQAAESLYERSPGGSEAQQLATRMLSELLQRPELSIEQAWRTAELLYKRSSGGSEVRQLATQILSELLQRPELSIEQVRQTAESLYRRSSDGSEAQQLAIQVLLILLSRPDMPPSKSDVYSILSKMVPYYHKLPLVNLRP